MPQYPIKCTCGWADDVFAKMGERRNLRCPQCGSRALSDPSRSRTRTPGHRQFKNDISVFEGWHPAEVQEARRILGERAAACIQDDGSVRFKDRSEQRHYVKTIMAAEARADQERLERKQAEREKAKQRGPIKPIKAEFDIAALAAEQKQRQAKRDQAQKRRPVPSSS